MNVQDWVHILFRSLGAVVILFALTRILGKKQISQLTFFEYVTGIALGEIAGFMSTGVENSYLHGLVALSVWFVLPFLGELVTLRSKTLREWFEGKGTVLIKEGKVLEDNLKKERYTADELLEQLRTKSVFRVADVEFATLEASGELSVLLKKENQPLTPAMLGIKVAPEEEPQTVIMDGNILDEPLAAMGLNRGWLHTELEKQGFLLENVFLGQVDAAHQLFLDLYDDQVQVPEPQTKAVLMATLKKCGADLELYALSVEQDEAKRMYGHCARIMNAVIRDMTPLLER
ncbi:DUF421 domain-containing protein [Paenibacillus xanthanilyticus]|uniref:DUF421 domain-containing protein n=1 Tax=Paenibacillus xanthanilyticus TaxID=1783531 RepID=A0ABV8K6R9_9BACL